MYSPQFPNTATVSVRRLAWALKKSMLKTVYLMVSLLPSLVEPSRVCLACQDQTKCHACIFSHKFTQQEQAALAVL
jgi:hypothetical protein